MAIDDRLYFTVLARRDDRFSTAPCEVFAEGVAVVALVGDQDLGLWAGLVHDRFIARIVGDLAAREGDGDGKAKAVGPQMDLGREATARAAKILILSPPFAPAAC